MVETAMRFLFQFCVFWLFVLSCAVFSLFLCVCLSLRLLLMWFSFSIVRSVFSLAIRPFEFLFFSNLSSIPLSHFSDLIFFFTFAVFFSMPFNVLFALYNSNSRIRTQHYVYENGTYHLLVLTTQQQPDPHIQIVYHKQTDQQKINF